MKKLLSLVFVSILIGFACQQPVTQQENKQVTLAEHTPVIDTLISIDSLEKNDLANENGIADTILQVIRAQEEAIKAVATEQKPENKMLEIKNEEKEVPTKKKENIISTTITNKNIAVVNPTVPVASQTSPSTTLSAVTNVTTNTTATTMVTTNLNTPTVIKPVAPEINEPKEVTRTPTNFTEKKDVLPIKTDFLKTFFDDTDEFMKKYVANGAVAYNRIDKNELKKLVQQIETMELAKANSTAKQAFYINAYNVLVIKTVLDNNIPNSPLDVTGFFDGIQHRVAGNITTLDKLEKQTLFGLKKDARFHFVVVCAAKGCPRIENFAYRPEKLEAQLTRQTKQALNNTDFIRVNDKKKNVGLSKIFEWYKKDFENNSSVLNFVNKYRNVPIPSKYKVEFYEYNWNLNKQ